MSPRCIALDLEFIKCRGEYFSRSIAFVPFRKCSNHGIHNSSLGTAIANTTPFPLSYHTAFFPPPCVLTLSTSEVMRTAELLPCGNVITHKVKSYLPSEEVLYEVKQKYLEEATESMTFYRDMRKDMREKLKSEHKTQKHTEFTFTHTKRSDKDINISNNSNSDSDLVDNEKEHVEVDATNSSSDNKMETKEMAEQKGISKSNNDTSDTKGNQHGMSEAEVALRRNLQIRVSIAQYFECIDPHNIPNIFCDCNSNSSNSMNSRAVHSSGNEVVKQQLISLYLAPLGSLEYTHALHALSPLRKYGKGRGGQKSLLFVCRYYPEFAREILQKCFPTEQIWLQFLKESAELVEADLNSFVNRYTSLSTCSLSSSATSHQPLFNNTSNTENVIKETNGIKHQIQNVITSIDINGEPCNAIVFRQCHSLEELSHEMNVQWSAYLYNTPRTCTEHSTNNINKEINTKIEVVKGTEKESVESKENNAELDVNKVKEESELTSSSSMCKFYVYGNVDKRVIRTTLQLSCTSERKSNSLISDNKNIAITSGDIGAVPTHRLLSPFQAQVTDITTHTLFALSGFKQTEKKIPSLQTALEKTLKYDNTAKLLWDRNQAHDPLWDAQALACVCTACNVCKESRYNDAYDKLMSLLW